MSLTITTVTAGRTYTINGIQSGEPLFAENLGDLAIKLQSVNSGKFQVYSVAALTDFTFDGANPASISDAVAAANAIVNFNSASGGSEAGIFIPNSATTPFANNAARDVWAAANLSALLRHRTVVEVTNTPNNDFYLWNGADQPASYDNTLWLANQPFLRGPKGDPGSDAPPQTGQQIVDAIKLVPDENLASDAEITQIAGSVQNASAAGQVITFTKADGSTFDVTVGTSALRPLVPDPAGGNFIDLRPADEDWDAGTGAFPSGGDAGYAHRVSGPGTVDGIQFAEDDLLLQLVDSAPTDTYDGNWLKIEGGVHSWGGLIGVIDDQNIIDTLTRMGYSRDVQTSLTNLENAIFQWKMNTAITDATNPGATFLALNNTDKDLATIISFNVVGAVDSARFDELLTALRVDDRIYIQEFEAANVSVLYRITGNPTLDGTKVNVPVAHERNQGPAASTFTNNATLIVRLFFTSAVAGSSLPQNQINWLGETTQQQIETTIAANINDTVTDVLLWRRSVEVLIANINDPGTGLLIAEANRQSNGTFDRDSGTSVYDDDLANAFIYVAITSADISGLTLTETFLEARRNGALVFSSAISDLTTTLPSAGQFDYFRTTNNQYHYVAGDTLSVVTRSTSETTEYNYSTNGDFTGNVIDLPFTAVDSDFNARVAGRTNTHSIVAADRVKLTGLLVSTTTTSGQIPTVLYKDGSPSGSIADYDKTWSAANPLLANFGSTRIVSIIVDNNIAVTSITGGATLGPQLLWIPGKYIYQVTIPAEIGVGAPTSHSVIGTTETFTPTGFVDGYKIVRANVEANLLAAIDAHGTEADISALETKLNALFPLTPDVDILINWANIYDPIHGAATVNIVSGYSLLADYRSASQRYESAGITFATGTNVVNYEGLSEDLHRSFGFALPQATNVNLTGSSGTANISINGVDYLVTFNTDLLTTESDFVTNHATALNTAGISVTFSAGVLVFVSNDPSELFTISVANVTGDLAGTLATPALSNKTLMWIVSGLERIPFVDITSAGNIRVNNFTPEQVVDERIDNETHFLTRSAGSQIVTTAGGSVATFTIPNFPSGATQQIRRLQIDVNIYEGTTNTQADHLQNIEAPAINADQSLQTFQASVFLGPLHGNQTVNVTIGYTFRVDGANFLVDLTLEEAPTGINVSFDGSTAAFLSYTVQEDTIRIDNFVNAADGLGDYTFTGFQEFVLSMRPTIGAGGEQTGYLEVVPAAVGADGVIHQLNDIDVKIPSPLWNTIEVADDIGFKTFEADHYFRHSEVAGLLQHRTEKWAYGLARLQTINAGHSITEAVDLAAGSTINGAPLDARTPIAVPSFTAATSVTVTIPNSRQLEDFHFVSVTWHTGVGTATDNANRNYTELGFVADIINGTDAEIILGGRGRGADNYGIEVTVPANGQVTTLAMEIINLNDVGGAVLPTGSLITQVRFY